MSRVPSPADARRAAEAAGRGAGVPGDPPRSDDEQPAPLPEIPSFPVEGISGPLRSLVEWGISDGLHPECMAAAGLAALATVTGPARLRVNQTRTSKPILWIALIGSSGVAKSPAFRHAFAQIRARYAAERSRYEDEAAAWREIRDTEGLKAAGPAPVRPEPLELDDTTTEAVARWLLARGSDTSGAVIDDELASFLEGLNQYKGGRGSDSSRWLKMWTGGPLHVQRVGKGGTLNEISLYVPDPVVSVAGPLVPENLHLLGKPGSGFRPRWLPFYAPVRSPRQLQSGDYPEDWTDCISALTGAREPREWNLSPESRALWDGARGQWIEQQSGAEPDDVIEALRKADEQCLRISLVLAESISPANAARIPAEAMSSAIAIVQYCIGVWRCLPGNSTMTTSRREDVMDVAHRRLVTWLETRPAGTEGLPEGSKPRPRATRRDLQRWLHEPPQKITELILEHSARYPGCVVQVQPPRGPATVYLYAPERVRTGEPKLSPRQFCAGVYAPAAGGESAGQGAPGLPRETVAETVAGGFATVPATVFRGGGGGSPRAAPETARRALCGQQCQRYGAAGDPLCADCRASAPPARPAAAAQLPLPPLPANMPQRRRNDPT